ncbi:hypothetical protein OM076_38825 [Solirubrobacter ginsenosidimutans]|uniref:Uncharacterized protein n=1 Tax=Solirubrobacter ginsenosidimutans TaxID=490573 RepID=A0A9X3N0Q0_9ACTN|nr:hypothetical protein [Solirubrobacter ginsenosidimutans]MDA0166284.1 hypothetical protein [Solirubrobacter ginsenosidimutans]
MGARRRAARPTTPRADQGRTTAGTEEGRALPPEDFDALVAQRLAARERLLAARAEVLEPQVTQRISAVRSWPVGRRCPISRLCEAWVAHRHGLAMVRRSGTWLAGSVSPALVAETGRAIELYEAYAEERPPDWPASGPAALCSLGRLGRADRFAGDVARLLGLAKRMRAAALANDPARLDRCRARAERRTQPPRGRFVFRNSAPRIETAEGRRGRVRDALLVAGANPGDWPNAELALAHHPALRDTAQPRLIEPEHCEELDGLAARAIRYRAELAAGRWRISADEPPTSNPKEA